MPVLVLDFKCHHLNSNAANILITVYIYAYLHISPLHVNTSSIPNADQ